MNASDSAHELYRKLCRKLRRLEKFMGAMRAKNAGEVSLWSAGSPAGLLELVRLAECCVSNAGRDTGAPEWVSKVRMAG